jgi:hypothetical protein
MFGWFLNWLEKKGRKAVIYDRNGIAPYLERWYVVHPDGHKRKNKNILFNVFIHRFMQSDYPAIHNHPWNWSFSIILKGGYWEHLPDKTIWRGPGSIRLMRPGNDLHWVEIPESGKTWTLFFRGKTISGWGFMPDPEEKKIIPWKEYLNEHRLT